MTLTAAIDGLLAVEQTITPAGYTLEVYRWWEPHLQPPCLWNELPGGSRTERRDQCRVEDLLRIDVVMVGPPSPDHGREMLGLEDCADQAIAALDQALAQPSPLAGRVASGRRLGLSTGSERLGAETYLSFRIPLELRVVRTYP